MGYSFSPAELCHQLAYVFLRPENSPSDPFWYPYIWNTRWIQACMTLACDLGVKLILTWTKIYSCLSQPLTQSSNFEQKHPFLLQKRLYQAWQRHWTWWEAETSPSATLAMKKVSVMPPPPLRPWVKFWEGLYLSCGSQESLVLQLMRKLSSTAGLTVSPNSGILILPKA